MAALTCFYKNCLNHHFFDRIGNGKEQNLLHPARKYERQNDGLCNTDSGWSECDIADSDWSESEENILESGKWKLERSKCQYEPPSKKEG